MKIRRVQCWLLRIPFTFPLVREQQHALANFVEIETDEGHKGHALSTYPLKHGIREFVNREAAPVIEGLDPMRTEEVRKRLFWATARKYFMGAWNNAASLIDVALRDIRGKALGQLMARLRSQTTIPIAAGSTATSDLVYLREYLVREAGHLHGGVPNGGRIEFHWQGWKCVEALFDNTAGPVEGYVTLPTGPGLGFTPKSGILDLAID